MHSDSYSTQSGSDKSNTQSSPKRQQKPRKMQQSSEEAIAAQMSLILDETDGYFPTKTTLQQQDGQSADTDRHRRQTNKREDSRKSSTRTNMRGNAFNDVSLDDSEDYRKSSSRSKHSRIQKSKSNDDALYPNLNDRQSEDEQSDKDETGHEENSTGSACLLMRENENLTVNSEIEFFQKLHCYSKDPMVKCLSIIGNTGDGKSYTLNKIFFDGEEIFNTSSSSDSCTMGVWAALDESCRTLVLDTEGRLGFSQNDNVRNRLLLKILCISDVVIYRTRAPKLPNDMFQFLSDASSAFHKFFRNEIENLMRKNQIEGPISTMGPSLIVFHETQHTDILSGDSMTKKTAVEQLKERFDKMKLPYDAYSSIEYVGTQTIGAKPTNFDGLKMTVNDILTDNKIRSPRRLSVIFRALKALNEKFIHSIPPEVPSTLPDDFFSCVTKCLSCGLKCTMTANHQKDGIAHVCDKQCSYIKELDNEVWKCLACHRSGHNTTVYGKLITKNDGLVQGLIRYMWLGYVIECPTHGEIYRSRKYWYGNSDPKDVTRVEVVHVWPDEKNGRLASDLTPRKVLECLKVPVDLVSQPIRSLGELCADKIAPSYWQQNQNVLRCRACGLVFGNDFGKHHCRSCGHIFCDTCTARRMIVAKYSIKEPQRVCETCATELHRNKLSPISTNNEPGKHAQKSHESYEKTTSTALSNTPETTSKGRQIFEILRDNVSPVVEMPIKALIEQVRPAYWRPDNECKKCFVCAELFNKTTRILHHCRKCGEGVCDTCSPARLLVPERDWKGVQRVCTTCETEIAQSQGSRPS